MSFREKLSQKYAEAYLKKYGDRLTQVQGHVLSVKVTTKTILWIYHILKADIVVKPERSKAVVRCQYKKNQWLKKPVFMQLNQGNMVIVQGLKPKKNQKSKGTANEAIQIINVRNLTTKKDLIAVDQQEVKRIQRRQFIK
ncbi:hypothetical protein [Fonticella tunisiensis]|uniref:Uncharacterized protein n=1 Tax=Fonticella tunisiensis TaxID=1096341 RepID=A0A4R7KR74_9CLOT|nr:hypothetical protein [Fonticella tunisiensis]TDT61872.1 hypothetical protein EDD71_10550 [Fonticella tunisiensis]